MDPLATRTPEDTRRVEVTIRGHTEVLILRDTPTTISVVIQRPGGTRVEAMLSTQQAAQLAEDLQRELDRAQLAGAP